MRLLCNTISFNIILGVFIYTSLRMQAGCLLAVRNGAGGGGFLRSEAWSQLIMILDAFAKLRKATISFVVYVRLSDRMKQPGFHWTDFNEIWYFDTFRNPVEKIQVSLESDKNNLYFTCRPIYNYGHIQDSSSYTEECF